jgi:hypothetical protein
LRTMSHCSMTIATSQTAENDPIKIQKPMIELSLRHSAHLLPHRVCTRPALPG